MSPCFKNWFKSFSAVFLILFLHFNAQAQGSSLLPEANRISGLPSNAVRCVALDKEGRIWTGTDNGLSILNANSITQKNIIAKIGNTSIWGINFLDSLVFVGSRFDGLFVFNFYTGKLINQFPSRAITLIRKIKVINGQVYILSNNGAYKWGDNKIIKLKFTENIQDDFPTDMFYWQSALYALSLRPYSLDFNVLKFNKNGFEEISTDNFFPIKNKKTILCAQTAGNILVIGGHGFYTILRDSLPPEMFTLPLNQKESFAVWDIAITKDNILLALGENISGNKGCLYVHGKTILKKEELTQCFITSFALDTANKSLYYGSLTNGLYLQRAINEILPINYQRKSTLIGNDLSTFLYDEKAVIKIAGKDLNKIKGLIKVKEKEEIILSKLFGDTLIVVTNSCIQVLNANTLKVIKTITNKKIVNPGIISCEIFNGNLIVFYNYRGSPVQINLSNNEISIVQNIESFLPNSYRADDKIILLNKEKGFNVIEKDTAYALSCDDKTIAFAESFAVSKNNLYTLVYNTIKSFKIDYKSHQLTLLNIFKLDSLLDDFTAKWLITKNGKLYVLHDKGILELNKKTGEPINYYYFGNYNEISKPEISGNNLLITTSRTVTKISFEDIDKQGSMVNESSIRLEYPESVNENLGFAINIHYPDYLLLNHSLKFIEIKKHDEVIIKKYSLGNNFKISSGMHYGDYDLLFKMGNATADKKLSISLPLNRNPYFFGFIILFVIITFLFILKSWLDKKEYNKKLMQNRLQVLKQNLNPHFVYNSMNLISSLILEEKYDQAIEVVAEFSNLQRTYLETNNKDAITLTQELKFLNSYLKLQQTRFHYDNNFKYFIYVSPEIITNNILIPPLILQPLAENAVKYGIIGSHATNKIIWVDVYGVKPIIISIEDSGENENALNDGFGMGHKLVKERIALFTHHHKLPIQIYLNKAPIHGNGYRVEIWIG